MAKKKPKSAGASLDELSRFVRFVNAQLALENARRIQKLIKYMREYAEPVVQSKDPCDLNDIIESAIFDIPRCRNKAGLRNDGSGRQYGER